MAYASLYSVFFFFLKELLQFFIRTSKILMRLNVLSFLNFQPQNFIFHFLTFLPANGKTFS